MCLLPSAMGTLLPSESSICIVTVTSYNSNLLLQQTTFSLVLSKRLCSHYLSTTRARLKNTFDPKMANRLTNCLVVILAETPRTAASGSHGDSVIIHGIMHGDIYLSVPHHI